MNTGQAILLIDDDREYCKAMAKMLARAGYHATVATDVLEAFGMLSQAPFDLIIMI
jgi:DNA-binding response OmpR family regulator